MQFKHTQGCTIKSTHKSRGFIKSIFRVKHLALNSPCYKYVNSFHIPWREDDGSFQLIAECTPRVPLVRYSKPILSASDIRPAAARIICLVEGSSEIY